MTDVAGEQAPPPGAAPQIFNLSRGSFARRAKPQNPADSAPPATPTTICLSFPLENSGRKLCKEAIFALGNGISRRKNQHPCPPRMSPGTIFMREGCGPLALFRGCRHWRFSRRIGVSGGVWRRLRFIPLALSRGCWRWRFSRRVGQEGFGSCVSALLRPLWIFDERPAFLRGSGFSCAHLGRIFDEMWKMWGKIPPQAGKRAISAEIRR